MTTEGSRGLVAAPHLAVSLAGALALLTGALVLLGWALDITVLKSILPGWVSVKPNTALCFILTGLSLLPPPVTPYPGLTSLLSNLARFCGLLAGLIGALTLMEYGFSWDLGIDQRLFPEPAGTVGTSVPGRMAPDTALCFVMLAASRAILRDLRKTRTTLLTALILCALVLIIALSDILTYFTPALGALGWWGATIMAVPTAAVFAVLGALMLWEIWRQDISMWSLSAAVTSGFALGICLLLVVGLSASRIQVRLQLANEQVAYSDTVLRQLVRIEAEVAAAQNHTRGYVITGSDSMLQSHAVAQANANSALAALRQSKPDSAPQRARFAQVEARAVEALQWFHQVIASRRSGPGVHPDQVRHGEDLMQALRAAIDEAERAQNARLRQSQLQAQDAARFTYATISGGMVLSLVFLAAALLWLNHAEAERIRTQAQLEITQRARAAGLYARSLLEASLDPLLTISAEGKITDVNRATEQATGLARADLIGTDFASYFTDPDQAREGYQRVFASSFVTDYALSIRHTSGRITDVLYNASVYRDEAGKVLGVFAAARDVTQRKKAEESLRLTEQRLNLGLQFAEMGVWDLDLIHDTAWRSLQHDRIFGYESAPAQWGREIATRHLLPEDREGFAQAFEQAFRSGEFFVECRVIRPDQSIHWIQAQGKVIGYEAGRPARMLGTVSDITRQRQASEALETLSRALERSNTELEQFAYVASHDLQEPLRMVVGYVQLLERRLADKLDTDTREFMAFAVDGATRMQVMIDDILAYSRVTTKAQPLARVDSAAALQQALDRLASRIKESAAEVDVQPLPTVMADRLQLVQLFQNLISNSIKFCKDRAPRIRVEAVRQAGRWRFSVTDNGIGIAPEYRAQLFVIFKRLHTQREYPGSGIGLAICKRIIERHGGEIGIDSAAGGGAVFWFTFPEEPGP